MKARAVRGQVERSQNGGAPQVVSYSMTQLESAIHAPQLAVPWDEEMSFIGDDLFQWHTERGDASGHQHPIVTREKRPRRDLIAGSCIRGDAVGVRCSSAAACTRGGNYRASPPIAAALGGFPHEGPYRRLAPLERVGKDELSNYRGWWSASVAG